MSGKYSTFLKSLLFLSSLVISTVLSYASDNDTMFVDKHLKKTNRSQATYFITKEHIKKHHKEWTWVQKIFYSDGQLKSECPVKAKKKKSILPVKDGECKEYYHNGILKNQALYKNGKRDGYYFEYYENSNLKSLGKVINDVIYVHHYIDSSKTEHIVNGQGVITEYDSVFNYPVSSKVIDTIRGNSFYIDSLIQDTIYTTLENKLELTSMHLDANGILMLSDIPYKKSKSYSRKILHLRCIVDENGRVIRTTKKNSIEKKIDHILSEKVKSVVLFTPPKGNHGKKVKAATILAVRF
ncbi:MAG: hypothetical protein H7329_01515 [Opitutaceae bacterium]|nr:hypothetical protein [Cytophagales bacterium]